MLNRLNLSLKILMGSFLGIFFGRWLIQYIRFLINPAYYAFMSAPWYTGILVHGLFTGVVILVCAILKLVVKLYEKRRKVK